MIGGVTVIGCGQGEVVGAAVGGGVVVGGKEEEGRRGGGEGGDAALPGVFVKTQKPWYVSLSAFIGLHDIADVGIRPSARC